VVGNKLKHSFTEKTSQFTALQNAVREQRLSQNQLVFEPQWETICVTNEITNDLVEFNNGINFKDIIKKEMVREITRVLYDSDLIQVEEINDPYQGTTKIKMELKIKKI